MTGQRWLIACVAVIVLAAPGCMTCGHRGHDLARQAGPECELPACQRNGVYVFAMSSLNPASIVALDGLREQLNRQGYAKVSTGQTIHAGWMAREMRRIRDADPDAVFVVVGFESAGASAVNLADRVSAEGFTVSGVVVINTDGTIPTSRQGLRVMAVGNVNTIGEMPDVVPVPDVATFGLATDARTVEAVGRMLNEAASAVPVHVAAEVAEWSYPYAPPMREAGDPARSPEWSFLFDPEAVVARPPVKTVPPVVAPPPPVLHSGGILKSSIR